MDWTATIFALPFALAGCAIAIWIFYDPQRPLRQNVKLAAGITVPTILVIGGLFTALSFIRPPHNPCPEDHLYVNLADHGERFTGCLPKDRLTPAPDNNTGNKGSRYA